MKFLVDAHLPRRLARWMNDSGHDCFHTLNLPLKNKTPDSAINQLSVDEQRIVITKDADFVDSFVVQGKPWKLLLISTGNIRNSELETLIHANIEGVAEAFESGASFVELSRTSLIVHN
jgi:predicted nuclease of predicted toxin-antitoxin system